MKQPVPLLGDDWILRRRPPRNAVSADRPYAFLVEPERAADGRLVDVATIFLTNRECPFRCLMCDLWKNTLEESVRPGQIVEQIRWALEALRCRDSAGSARQLKLYNAGSFFDPRAIPPEDYADIAELAAPFDRLIVECHPRLVGRRCFEFHDMLNERRDNPLPAGERVARIAQRFEPGEGCINEQNLSPGSLAPLVNHPHPNGERVETHSECFEVAMGLETVHPEVLRALNKGMTLDDFARASHRLRDHGISVRAFIMVRPPFLTDAEGLEWARRSIDFAFSVGVECCSLIPTRGGNGAMEELARDARFAPPSLESLEGALEYGLSLCAGRVFLDLWDIDKVSPDAPDRAARIARLAKLNLSQRAGISP